MLQILMTLFLAGLSQWALSTVADDGEDKEVTARVIVMHGEASDADADDPHVMVKAVVKRMENGDADDPDRGWLGVSIGKVSDAVGSQPGHRGRGVMVLSVFSDSPAQLAGLQENDIIVAVDGAELDGTVRQAVELIGSHAAGDDVTITALREGQEKTLTASLASRAEMRAFNWKMRLPSSADIEDEIRTHGCIIRRGPGGQWVVENLGDLAGLDHLPESVLQFIPQAGTHSFRVREDGGKKTVTVTVRQDDGAIEVEQENDGEIVVTRTDEEGEESTTTYANADELREGDAEAFDYFDNAGQDVVVELNIDGLPDLHSLDIHDLHDLSDIDIDLDLDLGELRSRLHEWQTNLGEGLENYGRYLEGFMEDFMKRRQTGRGPNNLPIPFGSAGFIGEPKHTFEVRVDGTIEARIRGGDSELIRLYANESDFETRNPDLFKKYQDLTAVEE